MSTVILGWGSLTYEWDGLSLAAPVRWPLVGPSLPIEFSRVSKEGQRKGLLTAVIDEVHGIRVPTRMSVSTLQSPGDVRAQLRIREGRTRLSWIGYVDRPSNTWQVRSSTEVLTWIREWLATTEHDAVVWTDIPPDFGGEPFSVAAAVAHFRALGAGTRQLARNYIAWAPTEVETPVRHALREQGLLDGADARPVAAAAAWQE